MSLAVMVVRTLMSVLVLWGGVRHAMMKMVICCNNATELR
jgi:hypothetical protein